MSYVQPPELYEEQSDVLIEDLSLNPLLPKSSIPTRNKGLNTTKQNVIQAVNEVLTDVNNVKNTTVTSLSQQESVLGNYHDTAILAQLQQIDSDVMLSLIKIYKDMVGDPTNPTDISDIAGNIKDAIKKLAGDIQSEKRCFDYRQDVIIATGTTQTNFPLDFKPDTATIKLEINGIGYESFSYDSATNSINWLFGADNGGFDLTDKFGVAIIYDYLYAENPSV